nr:hypothetical protein Hi04_10k_c554_00026 [uncultured bacterium]
MKGPRPVNRRPIVLVVDDRDWSARSLEGVLAPNGFEVIRASSAEHALERVRQDRPDAILINGQLRDVDTLALCRSVRKDPRVGDRLPIVMTSLERPPLEQRLHALESGAWDYLGYPHGAEELLLKLDLFVRSKLESDRLEDAGFIDQLTGLYSLPGVRRRGEELDSQAYRNSDALACLVLAASSKGSPETALHPELLRTVARALRDTARHSDVIGRTGDGEFVVLAPKTDATGATRLAERFSSAADGLAHERATSVLPLELRGGFDAVTDARATPRKADDLLLHASVALGQAKSDPASYWLKSFDGETEVAE